MKDSINRIWDGDVFEGTAIIYGATPDQHVTDQCDFRVSLLTESDPKKVRAYRENAKTWGEAKEALSSRDIVKELFVVIGPEMHASDVVETLERLVNEIKRGGMVIGRDKKQDYLLEFPRPV